MNDTQSGAPIMLVGVDLGQVNDFTAISVIEKAPREGEMVREERPGEPPRWVREALPDEYRVRYLDRPALGTPYPEIVEEVVGLVRKLGGEASRAVLAVDATGVGRAVIDMLHARLHEALTDEGPTVTPAYISITGGDAVTRGDGGILRVPKRDLVGGVVVLSQNGQLKLGGGLPLRDVLVRELENLRVKINLKTSHDSYEAWRESDHDDLVLSVALACWAGEQYSPPRPLVRVSY